MAVPFSLPSDDTTLEQYRTIHQLLLDLTAVLRTLLARNPEWVRSAETASTTHTANTNPAAANLVTSATANSDIMTNTHSAVGRQPVAANMPMPQFGLPLSPPNSQPGSPSPFFTATGGSAFILPDVVCNATRTLNELTPQQRVTLADVTATNAASTTTTGTVAGAATSSNGCNQPEIVCSISQRLRKRKRVKPSKKRKSQDVDLCGCGNCEKLLRRKIAKTTYSCTCCCFVATVDQQQQPSQQSQPQHCGSCGQDSVADDLHLPTMRMQMGTRMPMPTNECCCTQHLIAQSECEYKIPVCMHVGEELRKIVDCFRNPRKMNECISCTDDSVDVKSSSFLSQFGRTMFTAALLVIGWKLLKQN